MDAISIREYKIKAISYFFKGEYNDDISNVVFWIELSRLSEILNRKTHISRVPNFQIPRYYRGRVILCSKHSLL